MAAPHRVDLHRLVRRMRPRDGRAEGDHFPVRVMRGKDAAFQPGMNGLDGRPVAKNLLARALEDPHQRRIRLRQPTAIIRFIVGLATRQPHHRSHPVGQVQLLRLGRRAQQAADVQRTVLAADGRQVGGGLHQTRHGRAHLIHPVGQHPQHIQQPLGILDDLRHLLGRLQHQLQPLGILRQPLTNLRRQPGQHLAHGRGSGLVRQANQRLRFPRDGIAQIAPAQVGNIDGPDGHQHLRQNADGIAAQPVDVHPRVPAAQTAHQQPITRHPHRPRDIRQGVASIHAARAADAQLALVLVIQIDEIAALQPAALQPLRAHHPSLFRRREERLQRRMHQRPVSQHGQNQRHPDAIVRPQRRAVGRHPAVRMHLRRDRIAREVVHLVGILLRHHVQVPLQDHPRRPLMPGTGRLANPDVPHRIALGRQAQPRRLVQHVLLNGFLMMRRPRNLRELMEIVPDRCGLQIENRAHAVLL